MKLHIDWHNPLKIGYYSFIKSYGNSTLSSIIKPCFSGVMKGFWTIICSKGLFLQTDMVFVSPMRWNNLFRVGLKS